MEPGDSGRLLLPVGQALVTTTSASQRDLVDALARARSIELSGLLSIQSSAWNGHMLLVAGVPLYAYASRENAETPLLDRDAYEQLCLSCGSQPGCQIQLFRLDEQFTRALPGLFQRCALVRRLASASELRFLLEIVGGCRFDGCVQAVAGDERVIVLFHQGRPLGCYTARSRQIQASLAGSLAAVLSKPNPEVAFFPTPRREPAPLPSNDSFKPAPPREAPFSPEHAPAYPAKPPSPVVPARVVGDAAPKVVAVSQPSVPREAQPPASLAAASRRAVGGPSEVAAPGRQPATLSPPIAKPRPAAQDDLAESQMLWLLTALDRQWGHMKEKGLADAAVLTSLAGMISLCLAKVESVRTGTPDVPADPAEVEDVVERMRSRFPSLGALQAHGSRVDAAQLVAELRSSGNRTAEREVLGVVAEGMVSGLRLAFSKLVDQFASEATREEMRQTCDVYLADVEAELHALRSGALAVGG